MRTRAFAPPMVARVLGEAVEVGSRYVAPLRRNPAHALHTGNSANRAGFKRSLYRIYQLTGWVRRETSAQL